MWTFSEFLTSGVLELKIMEYYIFSIGPRVWGVRWLPKVPQEMNKVKGFPKINNMWVVRDINHPPPSPGVLVGYGRSFGSWPWQKSDVKLHQLYNLSLTYLKRVLYSACWRCSISYRNFNVTNIQLKYETISNIINIDMGFPGGISKNLPLLPVLNKS